VDLLRKNILLHRETAKIAWAIPTKTSKQAKQELSGTYLLSSRLQKLTKEKQKLRQQMTATTIAKIANSYLSAHLTIQNR
jgi:hypothetical protein